VHNVGILWNMTAGTKSATIQVRVMPFVKTASEQILRRIGLTMSEAVELFLRRMMVDERIPFDVVALQNSQIGRSSEVQTATDPLVGEAGRTSSPPSVDISEARKTRYRRKKEFKKFSGAHTPSQIRTKTASKKAKN
jgi:addiction module RelB/DinJ family antitoxin